ncbi:alpha/beta fold hydrolase [Flexivirga meconopsidis]|uniref:alpha/beta fold hydrolase n=1 Tax=Flexivirga meconopsidis TaxID=2977121 RepID=UPI0022401D9A|nr:alpha/beta fold hydrolase [Flexivirga meconopsidis]
MSSATTLKRRGRHLPVGYHSLHPDRSVNFQLNRFFGWVGTPDMLTDLRRATAGLDDYGRLSEALLELADARPLHDALERAAYTRMAEFFIPSGDPRKNPARESFLRTVKDYYRIEDGEQFRVPYGANHLPAYRFTPTEPKGTIVVFGGFDSYIEEWFSAAFQLYNDGYDTALFEGPGQGAPLEDDGLTFTADWQRPVEAILDYFELTEVTLMGFSMGGGLVLRAAAAEKRVTRVISYGVMPDLLDIQLHAVPASRRRRLRELIAAGDADGVDALMRDTSSGHLLLEWALHQGRHVTGKSTPFEVFQAYTEYETDSISSLIAQDVLLLHGNQDHYVPNDQLLRQIGTLTNPRSVTIRVFSEAEQAQNHCQVGNYPAALRQITGWLAAVGQPEGGFARSGADQSLQ